MGARDYNRRFDYLPLFYFGPESFAIKKNMHILWKKMGLILQGVQEKYCPTSSVFLALFEGPSKKTDTTFSN